MRSLSAVLAVVLGGVIVAAQESSRSNCRVSADIVRLPALPEASGVAASRRTPGLFWAHNDSGEPVLFALEQQGIVKGRLRVTGATVEDWEDIAVGACPQGSCIYIADIGDNDGSRKHITLYRVPEPAASDTATAPVETFTAAYPSGVHDAEALFVTPQSDVFLITKGDPGPVAVFRFPLRPEPGGTVKLEPVGQPRESRTTNASDRPTAADMSPDGEWVAVRTTAWVAFYRASDLLQGHWREAFRTDLAPLDEPRGEGIAFAGRDTIVLVGEGGNPLARSGTFARLACTFNR